MTTLDDQRIGDSIYRVLYDAPAIPGVCYQLAMEPVFIALAAVINVYLLQYSYGGVMPEPVWIGWSAFPIALILTLPASALVRRTNQTKRAAGSATTNAMEETFDNITAVQSLGGLKREAARFASRSAESFFRERVALAVSIALIGLGLIVIVVLGLYVNLLLAKPDASAAEIDKALADAVCLDFIAELPDGIDTVLGQSGDTLSVGQQQRLSIARGLLRNARVLILDEPTAALDPKTEAKLVETLRASAKGRLVVVIAHRLSTIRHADRIVFLDDGRIRDVGDHESLMAKPGGAYRTFVELQQPQATAPPATD